MARKSNVATSPRIAALSGKELMKRYPTPLDLENASLTVAQKEQAAAKIYQFAVAGASLVEAQHFAKNLIEGVPVDNADPLNDPDSSTSIDDILAGLGCEECDD